MALKIVISLVSARARARRLALVRSRFALLSSPCCKSRALTASIVIIQCAQSVRLTHPRILELERYQIYQFNQLN